MEASVEVTKEKLDDPRLFGNRELSLLAFQRRVLEEAQDPSNPLLERVKFLAILGSNMDEFFMVRVAGLQQKLEAGAKDRGADGRNAAEELHAIREEASHLMDEAYRCWKDELIPALAAEGIHVVHHNELTPAEHAYVKKFFRDTVFPVLTPLGYDPGRPFPHISSLSLNLAVVLQDRHGVERFARVKIPDRIDQLVVLPSSDAYSTRLVWLEQIVIDNVQSLFPGTKIVDCYPFRITRDAEVEIQELESDDLLETIEEAVWQRRFRDLVRLELSTMPASVMAILEKELETEPEQITRVPEPLDLKRLFQLCGINRPQLKYRPFVPSIASDLLQRAKDDIFNAIRREDVLLHHPFESFQPVVDFLRAAAADPNVLAIKMTLYRVGPNSPIVDALLNAVQEGKQVSVLVELKARFDEESNIEWAKALESNGVHVVYGLVGLKVHSKIALVVRREADKIRNYVHVGTGNYNPATARLYTDMSLFTCDEEIGNDAVTLFNRLTGYSEDARYSRLLVAPENMRSELVRRIEREIDAASKGKKAHIIAKMNAIDDPDMIRWLYRASQAGVQIDLIVRGICCLRPGVPGVSDNIRVHSILGRFLEHSRIYYFHDDGGEEMLIGSADWMTRNLSRRVEILIPIRERRPRKRLRELLDFYMKDNVAARDMQSDGSYVRRKPGNGVEPVEVQTALLATHIL